MLWYLLALASGFFAILFLGLGWLENAREARSAQKYLDGLGAGDSNVEFAKGKSALEKELLARLIDQTNRSTKLQNASTAKSDPQVVASLEAQIHSLNAQLQQRNDQILATNTQLSDAQSLAVRNENLIREKDLEISSCKGAQEELQNLRVLYDRNEALTDGFKAEAADVRLSLKQQQEKHEGLIAEYETLLNDTNRLRELANEPPLDTCLNV